MIGSDVSHSATAASLCLLLLVGTLCGQHDPAFALAVEIQGYPAGIIGAAGIEKKIHPKLYAAGFAAYNLTDRRDFGRHDSEEGGGPGVGAALRYYASPGHAGWTAGMRADVWSLTIDWSDDRALSGGQTSITVLQPTAQAGFRWRFGGGPWMLDARVSLGAEINVRIDGDPVGEGAILLVGVTLGYAMQQHLPGG